MTRKLLLCALALTISGFVSVAFAGTPTMPPTGTGATATAPIEPLPWLATATSAVGYCEGTCNGASEIHFDCDNLNPAKCCQLLEEAGLCYSFVGFCSGAWDARCGF